MVATSSLAATKAFFGDNPVHIVVAKVEGTSGAAESAALPDIGTLRTSVISSYTLGQDSSTPSLGLHDIPRGRCSLDLRFLQRSSLAGWRLPLSLDTDSRRQGRIPPVQTCRIIGLLSRNGARGLDGARSLRDRGLAWWGVDHNNNRLAGAVRPGLLSGMPRFHPIPHGIRAHVGSRMRSLLLALGYLARSSSSETI